MRARGLAAPSPFFAAPPRYPEHVPVALHRQRAAARGVDAEQEWRARWHTARDAARVALARYPRDPRVVRYHSDVTQAMEI
jgi:hypothetical protein